MNPPAPADRTALSPPREPSRAPRGASLDDVAREVERLVAAPPADTRQALATLAGWLRPRPELARTIFPRLLDAMAHPALAAAVLDLANYYAESGAATPHPAADRVDALLDLLGGVASRLERLEQSPREFAASPAELSRIVQDGVALAIAVCRAMALVGDPRAVPRLEHVVSLKHRRVRAEAAAALARLGQDEGIELLAALAAEPIVRSRVLAYLEELGQLERAAAEHRSPEARAAGALSAWMAEPTHFGLPPHALELVDQRSVIWPGNTAPVEAFLFRFEYRQGGKALAGIGIAGPTTAALWADLQDLPPADLYALYAGLEADHEEIQETPVARWRAEDWKAWEAVAERLTAEGYRDVQPELATQFFGEAYFVARAWWDERPTVVVASTEATQRFTGLGGRGDRALSPEQVYALFKGRALLRAFEPPAPSGP